jgi:proteasome lid subunit RPN8/RPN11
VAGKFPVKGADAPLRINFARSAYADVTAHAKESLEAEVCGVLVGQFCEDSDGQFVDVQAAIRGGAAREARAHVTFTHETWNQIHTVLDRDYRGLQIVGWYHSHPGFGVEFSAMDRFIQENFFSGPAQVALVTDPLGGDVAICCNTAKGLEYLPRFWVDAREHSAKMPGSARSTGGDSSASSSADLQRLSERIDRLVAAVEEQRVNFQRTLFTILIVACVGIVTWVTYVVWSDRMDRLEPPKVQSYVPVPVKVGDETVILGVGIVDWKVPPRLDAMMNKVAEAEVAERARQQQELEKARQQQEKKKPGNPPTR